MLVMSVRSRSFLVLVVLSIATLVLRHHGRFSDRLSCRLAGHGRYYLDGAIDWFRETERDRMDLPPQVKINQDSCSVQTRRQTDRQTSQRAVEAAADGGIQRAIFTSCSVVSRFPSLRQDGCVCSQQERNTKQSSINHSIIQSAP